MVGHGVQLTFQIVNEPAPQCNRLNLLHSSISSEIERMGRSHCYAGAHDTYARKCGYTPFIDPP
jgi:hypothetical protein